MGCGEVRSPPGEAGEASGPAPCCCHGPGFHFSLPPQPGSGRAEMIKTKRILNVWNSLFPPLMPFAFFPLHVPPSFELLLLGELFASRLSSGPVCREDSQCPPAHFAFAVGEA